MKNYCTMAKAGCHSSLGAIESGNEAILNAPERSHPARAAQSLTWARRAGIELGLTFMACLAKRGTIRQTIEFCQETAARHRLTKHPPRALIRGLPSFRVLKMAGSAGTRWEQVDMDKETVLDYPDLPAERTRVLAESGLSRVAFRPGTHVHFAKMLLASPSMLGNALNVAMQHVRGFLGLKSGT